MKDYETHKKENKLVRFLEKLVDNFFIPRGVNYDSESFCSHDTARGKEVLYIRLDNEFFRVELEQIAGPDEWEDCIKKDYDLRHMREHNIAEEAEQILRNNRD